MADSNIIMTTDRAKDKIPYQYCLSMGEILQLVGMSEKGIIEALIKAYDFGFIRGTRAYHRKRIKAL